MHNHFSKIAYRSPDFIIPHSLAPNKNEALFIVLSKRFPPRFQSNFHSRLWPHKNPFNCVASPAYHPHAPGCAHYHYHESRLWIRPASQVLWEPPFAKDDVVLPPSLAPSSYTWCDVMQPHSRVGRIITKTHSGAWVDLCGNVPEWIDAKSSEWEDDFFFSFMFLFIGGSLIYW